MALQSLDFGVSRRVSMEQGNLSNRESHRPVLSEISLTKTIDRSVSRLFKESISGSSGKKVVIKFVRTGRDKLAEFMSYTLENCLLSGYAVDADGNGQAEETIHLSFSKILVSVIDHNANNKSGSPQRVGYDLTTAKPL
ncbi:type VI secretion system tube protein Hcp [Beggiatoa alba]|nr:type VI secretion system tube protein Hcp [Beggiatoa alba]